MNAARRQRASAVLLAAAFAIFTMLFTGPASAAVGLPSPSAGPTANGDVIELRAHDARVLVNGAVVEYLPAPVGPFTLSWLATKLARPGWLTVSKGVASLRASVYQAPGSALVVSRPAVHSLHLVGSVDGTGGNIRSSGAQTTFAGVDVSGWDAQTGKAAAPSRRRSYLAFAKGSVVRMSNSTFSHLGRAVDGQRGVTVDSGTRSIVASSRFVSNEAGLVLHRPGTSSVTRSVFVANHGDGLEADEAGSVNITYIRADANSGNGLTLRAITRLAVSYVATDGNAGAGLVLLDTSGTLLTSISSTRNHDGGAIAESSSRLRVDTLRSSAEAVGLSLTGHGRDTAIVGSSFANDTVALSATGTVAGLKVDDVTIRSATSAGVRFGGSGLSVVGLGVSDSSTGVSLTGRANAIALHDLSVVGGSTGVRVGTGVVGVTVSAASINGAFASGVELLGGRDVALSDLTVTGSHTGVLAPGRLNSLRIAGAQVEHAAEAVDVSSNVARMTASHLVARYVRIGVRCGARTSTLSNVTVTHARTGLSVTGHISLNGLLADHTVDGIFLGPHTSATMTNAVVSATHIGLVVVRSAHATVRRSAIAAGRASVGAVSFRGDGNVLPLPALRWYGVVALLAAVAAISCELVRRYRGRVAARLPRAFPTHVTNFR